MNATEIRSSGLHGGFAVATAPIAPLGHETARWRQGLPTTEPVYPDPPLEAYVLRSLRRNRAIPLGAAARALGLTPAEVSDLEWGRRQPVAPSSWAEVLDLVRAAAPVVVP